MQERPTTWKDLSRLSQIQFRWMISMTALPGCRKGALARFEVCTLTNTPVAAIVRSCSSNGVDALNSTTFTWPSSPQTFNAHVTAHLPLCTLLCEALLSWLPSMASAYPKLHHACMLEHRSIETHQAKPHGEIASSRPSIAFLSMLSLPGPVETTQENR